MAAAQEAAERPLVVTVAKDEPPVIPDQRLDKTPLGQYVFQTFKREGGIGHVTWGLSQGKLPYGVRLAQRAP